MSLIGHNIDEGEGLGLGNKDTSLVDQITPPTALDVLYHQHSIAEGVVWSMRLLIKDTRLLLPWWPSEQQLYNLK